MNAHTSVIATLLLGTLASAAAQEEFELDEDALFGDTATVVDAEAFTDSGNVADEREQKSVSFSGGITASAAGSMRRSYFDDARLVNTSFQSTAYGDFNLDVRLPRSVKSFVSADLGYAAPADSLVFALNELFLDWNLGYRAFFRAGKQVLQWGRGYFFNPVDLVNVEKTRFFDELGGREGAFGLKAHVPFGTAANFYAFLDMGSVGRVDSLALAAKAEFLVRSTELAFSAWGRNDADPVFGFDFSTGLGDFMATGELALHRSVDTLAELRWGMDTADAGVTLTPVWQEAPWTPRISLGIGRYFDLGDINDRILVNAEVYYNHAGSESEDLTGFIPAPVRHAIEAPEAAGFETLPTVPVAGILERNNFSRWYLALFGTVSRFILPDMTFTANALVNLDQRCAMLTGGLSYTTLHNLSFDLILSGFPGPDYTEYTIFGQGLTAELRTGIRF